MSPSESCGRLPSLGSLPSRPGSSWSKGAVPGRGVLARAASGLLLLLGCWAGHGALSILLDLSRMHLAGKLLGSCCNPISWSPCARARQLRRTDRGRRPSSEPVESRERARLPRLLSLASPLSEAPVRGQNGDGRGAGAGAVAGFLGGGVDCMRVAWRVVRARWPGLPPLALVVDGLVPFSFHSSCDSVRWTLFEGTLSPIWTGIRHRHPLQKSLRRTGLVVRPVSPIRTAAGARGGSDVRAPRCCRGCPGLPSRPNGGDDGSASRRSHGRRALGRGRSGNRPIDAGGARRAQSGGSSGNRPPVGRGRHHFSTASRITLLRMAHCVSSARSCTSSFRIRFVLWTSTVFALSAEPRRDLLRRRRPRPAASRSPARAIGQQVVLGLACAARAFQVVLHHPLEGLRADVLAARGSRPGWRRRAATSACPSGCSRPRPPPCSAPRGPPPRTS